jgi:hypothetical protein
LLLPTSASAFSNKIASSGPGFHAEVETKMTQLLRVSA